MRTIMIRDEVYNMLADIKDDRSFSETIESLVKSNNDVRKKALYKFAGILSSEEADVMSEGIKEVRKNATIRTFG